MKRLLLILFFVVISNAASVLPTDIFPVFSDSEKLQGFNDSYGQNPFIFDMEASQNCISKGEVIATAVAAKEASDQAAVAKITADKAAAYAHLTVKQTADIAKAAGEMFDRAASEAKAACRESVSADIKLTEAERAFTAAKALVEEKNLHHVSTVEVKLKMLDLSKKALKTADEAVAAAKLTDADRITANIKYADAAIATERAFAAVRMFDECGDAEVMV